MGQFFAYSIQSAICLAIFYLFYKILLSRETFHRFNRIALIGILALSWIIPLVLTFFSVRQTMTITDTELFSLTDEMITSVKVDTITGDTKEEAKHPFLSFLLLIYLLGCVIFLIRILLSTGRIIHLISKGKCFKKDCGIKLVILKDKTISPFSWMSHIVLSAADYEESGDTIVTHETAHIRLNHTYDLIIAQTCLIVQWFNPAAWLLYQELQNIHEYEADEAVIHQGIDAKQYQLLLIKKAVGTRLYSMANSFNHSNLKKRITMMLQKKSNSWARLKYAYVLPLAITTVAAFAHPEISKTFKEISNAKISHFALTGSTNEVKNLSDATISGPNERISNTEGSQTTSVPSAPAETPTLRSGDNHENNAKVNTNSSDTVFATAEYMPEFPGGDAALLKWIADNIKYPESAAKDGVQGRVACTFTVEKDGSVSDAKVVRPVHPALDEEAIRIVTSLPAFTPGKNKGKVVRVLYSIPVRFKLPGENSNNTPPPPPPPSPIVDKNDPTVFVAVEKMPEFPGGDAALLKWIADNIKYPENAKKNGIQGRVACRFVVDTDGSISNVQVVRPVDPELDAEAIRVLQMLPKFTPGTEKGKAVKVRYSVPVRFAF